MFDRNSIQITGMMLATTIGAGIFALPYVFSAAGVFLSAIYLIVLALILGFAHDLYFRLLKERRGNERLVGMATRYLSPRLRDLALLVVGCSLTFTLVAYVVLGADLLRNIFPILGSWAVPVFWLICALPLLTRLPRLFFLEFGGAIVIILMILAVFAQGFPFENLDAHLLGQGQYFLPFGLILFALAGLPAVEPIFDESRLKGLSREETTTAMRRGTHLSALLYGLFVLGILGAFATVPQDVLSVTTEWPLWLRLGIMVFGLFAVWTSYAPVSFALMSNLEHDLHWHRALVFPLVVFLPLVLVALGLRNFLAIAGVAGGVFVASEYLLVLFSARRALVLSLKELLALYSLIFVFSAAIIYEIYYFVVQ